MDQAPAFVRAARRATLVLLTTLLASGAMAEERIAAHRVIATLSADWTGDGWADRAILIENDIEVGLRIYVGGPDGDFTLSAAQDAMVWQGVAAGTKPYLALSRSGTLQVISGNEAIGRNRWRETLTILWRGERFVVGGYTRVERDTLDTAAYLECDLNLLTGRGIVNDRPVKHRGTAAPVGAWQNRIRCAD